MRITSRRSVISVALSALVIGLLGSTAPAMAEDPTVTSERPEGTVLLSGVVKAPAGALAGAYVGVFVFDNSCWTDEEGNESCNSAWLLQNTGDIDPTTGAYSLYAQANQTVRLLAQGAAIYDNAYGRTPTMEVAEVSAGSDITTADSDITGLDIDVLAKPAITGTITLPAGALEPALPGDYVWSPVTVTAYSEVSKGSFSKWVLARSIDIPANALAESGLYRLPVERAGTYRVSVSGYWIEETFYGGDSLDNATDIAVDATGASGIDFSPSLLPLLSGKVTPPQGSAIEKNLIIAAIAFDANGQPINQDDATGIPRFGFAAADGTFSLPVPEGTYVLLGLGQTMYGFYGEEPACFLFQGLDKNCFPATFNVGSSGGTGYDFQLRLYPGIRGTVSVPEGMSPTDVSVQTEQWNPGNPDYCLDDGACGEWTTMGSSSVTDNGDGTGSYFVPVSEPGAYRVVFSGPGVETQYVGGDSAPNDDAATFTSLVDADAIRNVTLARQLYISLDFDASGLLAAGFSQYARVVCNGDVPVDEDVDLMNMPLKVSAFSGKYSCELWVYAEESDFRWVFNLQTPSMDDDGYFDVESNVATTIVMQEGPVIEGTARVTSVGDGSATVEWDSQVMYDGGAPVQGYRVTARDTQTDEYSDAVCETDADARSCTVSGLTNLREYTFFVSAFNTFDAGTSLATDYAVPHEDRFQIFVPEGNVQRNGYARIWVLGAQGFDSVPVRVGNQMFEVTPRSTGDGVFIYNADESIPNVIAGKVKITARASRINDAGRRERVAARATLYVPKFSVRSSWKQGSIITARISALQPGSSVSATILDLGSGEFAEPEAVCTAQADEFGRARCTFDAPPAGEYVLRVQTGAGWRAFTLDSKVFTVKPSKRS